eukprot:11163742-Lingulodinium_polyedra.AAC.1
MPRPGWEYLRVQLDVELSKVRFDAFGGITRKLIEVPSGRVAVDVMDYGAKGPTPNGFVLQCATPGREV